MTEQPLDAAEVWTNIKKRLLDELPFNLAVFDAINAAEPITIDDRVLVLGYDHTQLHFSGHLRTADRRNIVVRMLQEGCGAPFTFEVIEGTTLEDWQTTKTRMATAQTMRDQSLADRLQKRTAKRSWDELGQELYRNHGETERRQLPQTKAQFLLTWVPRIGDMYDELRDQGDMDEETNLKQMARVIDKLAAATDVPPSVVALEIARHRKSKTEV